MNKRERTARIVDAIGGGLCPIHGEYLGTGKYGLRACPYCDIDEFWKRQMTTEKGGRPRNPTLAELRQQELLAQENNNGGKDTPSILASNNRTELLRLYKLCYRSNSNRNKTEAGRA